MSQLTYKQFKLCVCQLGMVSRAESLRYVSTYRVMTYATRLNPVQIKKNSKLTFKQSNSASVSFAGSVVLKLSECGMERDRDRDADEPLRPRPLYAPP